MFRAAAQRGVRHYEFPTGYNFYFGAERLQVGEQYFTHSPQLVVRAEHCLLFYAKLKTACVLCRLRTQISPRQSLL